MINPLLVSASEVFEEIESRQKEKDYIYSFLEWSSSFVWLFDKSETPLRPYSFFEDTIKRHEKEKKAALKKKQEEESRRLIAWHIKAEVIAFLPKSEGFKEFESQFAKEEISENTDRLANDITEKVLMILKDKETSQRDSSINNHELKRIITSTISESLKKK